MCRGMLILRGIFELFSGARITHAVEMAGGLSGEADLSRVNLAQILEDGQRLYIPSRYDDESEVVIERSDEQVLIGGSFSGTRKPC